LEFDVGCIHVFGQNGLLHYEGYDVKWTIRKVYGRWIVTFEGELPLAFYTRANARAYVNDRVLTAMGV
jgi:hypothetical protein